MKPTRLILSEHAHSSYTMWADEGDTLADVSKPEVWSHTAKSLRIGDLVTVVAPDVSWEASFRVRAVGRHEAILGLLSYTEHERAAVLSPDDSLYEVKWRGPARKFSIIRKSDGEIVRDEFPVREHADQWLKNHLRSMAA